MSIETIRCRECGSADMTEFKPSSYVCGHCEALVNAIRPTSAGLAAACEIAACGVRAVGRCFSCGQAFCGTTRRVRASRRTSTFCAPCQAENIAREEATAQAERVDRQDGHRRRLQAIVDPVERLVVSVRSLCHDSSVRTWIATPHGERGTVTVRQESLDVWNKLFPQCPVTWSTNLNQDPQWDSREVGQWFASRARAMRVPPATTSWVTYSTGVFGATKSRLRQAPGWEFQTATHGMYDTTVLTDGQIKPDGHNLTAYALRRMGSLLNIWPLAVPPDSGRPVSSNAG
jgi:hypothetical protein